MTVSEYIFDFLQKKGIETVYMVSGSSAMWLTDSLYKNDKLSAICCHHEQACAMAADGYGRIKGIPGVCLVTIGPGATNAITGVAQAYLDSSPMFVISGQASSKLLKYEKETGIRQHGTQSLNLEPLVTSITKYFAAVMEPSDIKYHMEKAYFEAMNGRKGPVWIDVPIDIQNKSVPLEMEGFTNNDIIERPFCDYHYIIDRLVKAKKPLILAGGGIRQAGMVEKLKKLCEIYEIPVVTSRGGIDVIASDSKYFVGRPGAYGDRASHHAIQSCDTLLILGSRLSVSTVGYYPNKLAEHAEKIMVDVDPRELAKEDVTVQHKYCIELNTFINNLLDFSTEVVVNEKERDDWFCELDEYKTRYPNVKESYKNEIPLNEYYVTAYISSLVSPDCNIVVDTGSICNIVSQSWYLKEGQRYLISGGLSCMGFWATAEGAYETQRQLIAITGDGSAQMNIQELATLKTNNIPLKLFIYNNNGYMLIRHNQHNYMDDRFLGVGPDSGVETPCFCKVAEAYGIKNYCIKTNDDLRKQLPLILEYGGPVLVEVMVQEFAPIIPRIASKVMPDGSLRAAEFDDLFPFLDENGNENN